MHISLIQICKQLLIHTSTCIFSVLCSYWLYRLKNENKDNRLLMADLLNNFIFQKNYPQNCQLLVSNHFGHFFQQFPTFRAIDKQQKYNGFVPFKSFLKWSSLPQESVGVVLREASLVDVALVLEWEDAGFLLFALQLSSKAGSGLLRWNGVFDQGPCGSELEWGKTVIDDIHECQTVSSTTIEFYSK